MLKNNIHRGTLQTEDEIRSLISAFETCTLPRDRWTHRAHLIVGLWYLLRYPQAEATNLIRESIQKYNHACGIVTTKESGYHETITLFYVWLIGKYLQETDRRAPLVEQVNGLIEKYGEKSYPLEYYSKERLMSWEARSGWVEPDLKALG